MNTRPFSPTHLPPLLLPVSLFFPSLSCSRTFHFPWSFLKPHEPHLESGGKIFPRLVCLILEFFSPTADPLPLLKNPPLSAFTAVEHFFARVVIPLGRKHLPGPVLSTTSPFRKCLPNSSDRFHTRLGSSPSL